MDKGDEVAEKSGGKTKKKKNAPARSPVLQRGQGVICSKLKPCLKCIFVYILIKYYHKSLSNEQFGVPFNNAYCL